MEALHEPLLAAGPPHERWFAQRGWSAFDFQREVWAAMAGGQSGLLHATTGSGKTYAVWMGALQRGLAIEAPAARGAAARRALDHADARTRLGHDARAAVAARRSRAAVDRGPAQRRHAGAERARQDRRFPTALVTTPESLSLMLTRENARAELAGCTPSSSTNGTS